MGLRMNIAKTKVLVADNTPINVKNVLIENVDEGYINLQPQGKELVALVRARQPPQRRPMDLTCHHLGDHKTRKDDKGDQPSDEETTWTNIGGP